MADDIEKSVVENLEVLTNLIPEIKNMIGFEHKHPQHHLDVWQHTLLALSLSERNFDVRLTLLLHDIGKPFSFVEQDGIRHYPNHAETSANMANEILTRLKFEKDFVDKICYLIKYHDTPICEDDVKNNKELAYTRYLVQKCDALAHDPACLQKRKEYLKNIEKMFEND